MVPPGVRQTGAALLYDRFNREVKYVLTHGLQVWQLLDIHYTIWRLLELCGRRRQAHGTRRPCHQVA